MKVQGRRKRGRPKIRGLGKVKNDIKEKRLSTVLHGGVCHRTSTPHKSGNKIKEKKKKSQVINVGPKLYLNINW